MTAADQSEFTRRAWRIVQDTFDESSYCSDCESCIRTPERTDEPATRDCAVMTNGDDPLECPGVDEDAIRDDMDAEREEYEDSRRDK